MADEACHAAPPPSCTTSPRSATIRYEGKCDICTKPDGSRGHNLQRCRGCGVLVHELCYGMIPTATKNPDFLCHACKAVANEGGIEVNVPSKVGGWILRDVLAKEEGIASFREFLRACGDDGAERKLDFCIAANEFQSRKIEQDEADLWGDSLKTRAQHIFDTFCSNNAERKVDFPSDALAEIEAKIYGGNDASISPSLFDAVKKHAHQSLQNKKLGKYKQSASYKRYVATQRTFFKQEGQPTECALCSVKGGIHAMHPLYDFDGKEGRQLCLPASGVGFMRKEKRLAWVHTLCAMFICSSGITGSLVYGCDEDGKWESEDEDETDEENNAKRKVIDSEDSEDEDEDTDSSRRMKEEQLKFTECEEVFLPLMKRLQESINVWKDAKEILDSMVYSASVLTPPFIREYEIGLLVKRVRKRYEEKHQDVKAHCKRLSAEMKRVYKEKENQVPDGFKPVKNLGKVGIGKNKARQRIIANENANKSNEMLDANPKKIEQKYKVGTTVSKEFVDGMHTGKISDYDSNRNLYHIVYDDGDSEDLEESEVSKLILAYTAFFCMASPVNGRETNASLRIKSFRKFICVICRKKDDSSSKCLRIPVQCSAGDPSEFVQFKKYHKKLNSEQRLAKQRGEEHRGCAEPMHVGCARWGSDYARVKNKHLRMCYYFPGKPPTYTGEDGYQNPVSNCFCRKHAIEVQEGISSMAGVRGKGKESEAAKSRKRIGANDEESSMSNDNKQDNSEEDTAEEAKRLRIAILKKKRRRIMSDEESE